MRGAQANAKANQQITISAIVRIPALTKLDRDASPERNGIVVVVAHALGIIIEGPGGIRRFTTKVL